MYVMYIGTCTSCAMMAAMAIPISQFRRDIFSLVDRAAKGEQISFTHKGRLFRVQPEVAPTTRLARLTPLEIVGSAAGSLDRKDWQQEMIEAWERDWADL